MIRMRLWPCYFWTAGLSLLASDHQHDVCASNTPQQPPLRPSFLSRTIFHYHYTIPIKHRFLARRQAESIIRFIQSLCLPEATRFPVSLMIRCQVFG